LILRLHSGQLRKPTIIAISNDSSPPPADCATNIIGIATDPVETTGGRSEF